MIVHFVKDEKITDQIIENFLQVSIDHIFLVFVENSNQEFKYIRPFDNRQVKQFDIRKEDINEVLKCCVVSGIILHSLDYLFAKALVSLKIESKIAWIVWGFEIYKNPKNRQYLFGIETKRFLYRKRPFLMLIWKIQSSHFVNYLICKLGAFSFSYTALQRRSLQKIDLFCSYIYEDYEYFKVVFPQEQLDYLHVTFSSIGQYLAGNIDQRIAVAANNIFVGNSKTVESNYLEVISLLKEHIGSEKCFFVLSYGADDYYKREVIRKGTACLGDRFHPLLKFMDRSSYIEIMRSCSVGIFNHHRQQAMGNIIAMLYMGARVYLSDENPLFRYFLRHGITVNSFEREYFVFKNEPLGRFQSSKNREILHSMFSKERVLSDLSLLSQYFES